MVVQSLPVHLTEGRPNSLDVIKSPRLILLFKYFDLNNLQKL